MRRAGGNRVTSYVRLRCEGKTARATRYPLDCVTSFVSTRSAPVARYSVLGTLNRIPRFCIKI